MDTELHVYDFDGTLFRSPHRPAVWGAHWWSDPASLLPPCVPEKPGADWWVSKTVAAAKKSIGNGDVFAMMITGRNDKSAFRYRVPELLKQKGLNFDAVHLTGEEKGLTGKLRRIVQTLKRYPFITKVQIWDDRTSHLREFASRLERAGFEVEVHPVRATSHDPLCETPAGDMDPTMYTTSDTPTHPKRSKRGQYWGIFLDARSKAALARIGFNHDKIRNDHVTLGLGPMPLEEFDQWVGEPRQMKAISHYADDKGQAVEVKISNDTPFHQQSPRRPHVTLSHDPSVGPVYSNELIAKTKGEPISIPLSGIIDTFPRSLSRRASSVKVASLYRVLSEE
jgi:hypothetical protein